MKFDHGVITDKLAIKYPKRLKMIDVFAEEDDEDSNNKDDKEEQ